MKKQKQQSFGEWMDQAIKQSMAFLGIIFGITLALVFFGWLGLALFAGAVGIFWYAKHIGEI